MRLRQFFMVVLLASASVSAQAELRRDEGIGFYIGLDTRLVNVGGTYNGLDNPNGNRITLLLEHVDHYHGIGTYSLTGPAGLPTVVDTNSNNQIPEVSSGEEPLPLSSGAGLYAGTLRSAVGDSEYSYLGMASTASLDGFPVASPEYVLYNSSAGRWAGSLAGVEVGLQLVSLTPGLNVGTDTDTNIFDGGDVYSLGDGAGIEFKPVFWVASDAPGGTYTAGFRLINLTDGSDVTDSGRFYINFAPVPEPETYALFGLGLLLLGVVRRRST